jgi:alpha-2-macroglobulin
LSDDLTSWHVTASAVTGHLQAGVGELLVPVGLPFFVEVTTADSYLVSDRPSIQARAFGDALRIGDPVEFTLSSTSLGLERTTIQGRAFEPVSIALPPLSLGTPSIRVSATATTRRDTAGNALHDGLLRTFDVVISRLTATRTTYGVVADGRPSVPEGAEQSTWTFTDAGRGRLIPILSYLSGAAGIRIDRGIASSMARQSLVEAFGRDPAAFAPSEFDPSAYPIGRTSDGVTIRWGVALLPYGDLDPWLAARIAVEAPDGLNRASLQVALDSSTSQPIQRDLRIAALAGMAALDEPVLGDLDEAERQPDLSPTEQIYLALGFEAAGDDASAVAIERDLLTRFGERLGSSVRLRLDPTADGADPTALLAVVAAGLGDPLAADLAEYAFSHPAIDTENSLELAAYAARYLVRTPGESAAFAYTVGGARSVVRLAAGQAFTLTLTAEQAANLAVEKVSGSVGVAIEARVAVTPDSLRPSTDLTLTRKLPTMPIALDKVVYVDLAASFGARAPDGCYDVVELVPSGLAPLTISDGQYGQTGVTWPSSVVGQEVRFCAYNDVSTGRAAHLRYAARVVNAGKFAWEPATMQLAAAPELLAATPSGTATVGGP